MEIYGFSKRHIVLLMVATILLSGILGYTGAYIARYTAPEALTENVNSQISPEVIKTGFNNNLSTLSIPEIVFHTADSVVEITTETVTTGGRMGQYVSEGAGSGVIISEDGYIVTNNHVIENASKIIVRLRNGHSYEAMLVGRDTKTDMAVLKIEANDLKSAYIGNSDKLLVGELAVVIGNPLGALGGTVTEGIISALNRDIIIDGEVMNLLQTSAAINPGNSGGGLFNSHGELVGIVNAKSSGSGIEGLGFAIPVNIAIDVAEQIIEYGYVLGRIDFGADLIDIKDSFTAMMYRVTSTGVYVQKPTLDNDFKAGDKIISINDEAVKTTADVKSVLDKYKVGDVVKVQVQRSSNTMTLDITLHQAKY